MGLDNIRHTGNFLCRRKNTMIKTAILTVAITAACSFSANAKPVCVEVEGESAIVRNDFPSAKIEAVNRAKWAAVEQVAGVDLKSRTVVQDSALLEDMISTRARGVITSHRVLRELRGSDSTVKVRISACVEPSQAREAVAPLAINSTVAVFIPSRRIGGREARYDDTNQVSEGLNNALIEKGFTVKDLAEGTGVKASDIEKAMKSGEFVAMRSIAYRYNTNTILIGRIEPVLSTRKGEDIGYGMNLPFNKVTARLSWRLLTRDPRGELVILAAGTEEAAGLSNAAEDAQAAAMKNLSDKFIPVAMAKINQRIKDLANKVSVKIEGIKTPEQTFAAKEELLKLTWVSDVTETGIGEFRVTFPENPLYLANGLSQRGYKITSYSRESIRIRYQ